jgi:soluble lytic murein transglycosylase
MYQRRPSPQIDFGMPDEIWKLTRGAGFTAAVLALSTLVVVGAPASAANKTESLIVVAELVPQPRFNPQRNSTDPIAALIDGNTTTEAAEPTPPVQAPALNSVGFNLAIRALDKNDPAAATLAVYSLPDRTSARVINWLVATGGYKSVPSERIATIKRELADWPGQTLIQIRLEQALLREESPAKTLVAMLGATKPETGEATVALARALRDTGRTKDAKRLIGAFWRNSSFEPALEKKIISSLSGLLTKSDHKYRMDRLLYDNEADAALRTAGHLGKAQRNLAAAVAAVIRGQKKADGLLAALPAATKRDPLHLYSLIQRARRADKNRKAADLLIKAPKDAKKLIDPDAWWVERRIISRAMAEEGQPQLAYKIAAGHSARSSTRRAEAEFHAGWFALEYLGDSKTATPHFKNITKIASRPLSLSRAHYWLARSAESGGDSSEARGHYRRASKYSTTFYGQLALEKLKVTNLPLSRSPSPTQADRKRFNDRDMVKAIRLLEQAKYTDRVGVFYRRLAVEIADPAELRLLSEMATAANLHQTALQIGIIGASRGRPVDDLAFTTSAIPANAKIRGVEKSMVYAIARQESRFNREAISRAGARGLLQLMPATARETSRSLGLRYSKSKLISDPAYNATLGAAYLGEMVGRFDGSYVMTFAAYNAGASRVDQWVKRFGDPRDPDTDVVNWIEAIPFTETRNYVQRIMENLQVYRARFGTPRVTIEKDLRRGGAS